MLKSVRGDVGNGSNMEMCSTNVHGDMLKICTMPHRLVNDVRGLQSCYLSGKRWDFYPES